MCIKKNFKKTCVATQLFTLQVQLEIKKRENSAAAENIRRTNASNQNAKL